MTYTHLSTDELVIIESYFHQNASVSKISEQIGRARQTVHNVVTFLKDGHTALDFYKRYKANNQHCDRKQTVLSNDQRAYVAEKVAQGWTPDVIVGRREQPINCNAWFHQIPRNVLKSMTFDCGKEFSNWQSMSNRNDIDIYFADRGTPSERGLNEHSNGLLRKDGLSKHMDFNTVDQRMVASVASKRNHIPRKSLNYQTPLEAFMSYMDVGRLSSLF